LLVDSVKNHGIQVPLVVRKHPRKKDKFQIVCGFRRATAAHQVGYERVPVVIRDLKDEEAHILSYAENENRKTLSDLDRANGIAKLRATKKTTAQVAGLYRLSERQVQRLEGLLEYPDELKKALDNDESGVTTTHALVLMQATKKPGARLDLKEWISRIRKERMTVEALRSAMRESFAERRRSRRPWRWSGTKFTMSLRTVEKWSDAEREQAITEVKKLLAKLKG
jgi:ParB/RepB/Spo0J family partition protein